MPNTLEIATYVLGVRAEQALRLATRTDAVAILGAIYRLEEAVNDLCDTTQNVNGVPPLSEVLAAAGRIIRTTPTFCDPDAQVEICEQCYAQLVQIEPFLRTWSNRRQHPAFDWYRLGREIVRGEGGDDPPPFRNPPVRRPWEWDHPQQLQQLCNSVSIRLADVFPEANDVEWPDDLPQHLSGWLQIEKGIESLRSNMPVQRVCAEQVSDSRQARRTRILAALSAATSPMTAKEIHTAIRSTYTRESENMLRQELPRMVDLGLVQRADGGYVLAGRKF